jgi:monofunctional biosynthetic peptidoglycan transglycosylase
MKWKIGYLNLSLVFLLLLMPDIAATEDTMTQKKILIDFSEADDSKWRVINDGVMGGVSRGNIQRTDQGTGVFSGVLSLENNGGFASIRSEVGTQDLSSQAGLEIRVRGDGRTYQLRIRVDNRFEDIAYRAYFDTVDGEWITVTIPFDEFLPVFRGRILKDAPALDTSRVNRIGFLLADKKPGSFSLEIDFVRAMS